MAPEPEREPEPEAGPTDRTPSNVAVRRALRWYLLWSLVALVLVSAGVVLLSSGIARNETMRDAEFTTRAVADTIVAPLLDDDFHAGDPVAVADLEEAMALRSRDGSVLHVKLWEDAGGGRSRILWADEPAIVGETFAMDPLEYGLFGTDRVVTEISDLQKPENAFERYAGELVEVYAGLTDATGAHLLFEAYIPAARVADDTLSLTRELLPLTLGALLVLSLSTLPLAVSLARRVDRAQADRRRLLHNAIEASDLERRRIAQDLHDEVIQDLAGVGYSLSSVARELPADSESRARLDQVGAIVRRDVASLRTLMTDIYPPDLDTRGLAEAVRDLLTQEAFAGIDVMYDVDEPLAPSPTTARLAFRVIRESLRNVAKHARARSLVVRLRQEAGSLRFEVIDDGVGFDADREGPQGHLGLRLIQETVADAGGSLIIDSTPGHGARVAGMLPN